MSLTWMHHPQHGVCDFYDDLTVSENLRHGWRLGRGDEVSRLSKPDVESSSTETKGLDDDRDEPDGRGTRDQHVLQMRKIKSIWESLLPGMREQIYAELEEIASLDGRTKETRQLKELREYLSDTGENPKEAMRHLWGPEFTDASPRLRSALADYMVLPETPQGAPQTSGQSESRARAT